MDNRARLVPREDLLEPVSRANIPAFERPPPDCPRVPLFERVETDRREPRFRKRLTDVAADIPRAAGDQDNSVHGILDPSN